MNKYLPLGTRNILQLKLNESFIFWCKVGYNKKKGGWEKQIKEWNGLGGGSHE